MRTILIALVLSLAACGGGDPNVVLPEEPPVSGPRYKTGEPPQVEPCDPNALGPDGKPMGCPPKLA